MEDPVSPSASMGSLWEASSATSGDSGNLYEDLESPCGSDSEVSDSDIFQELGVVGNLEEKLPASKESFEAEETTDKEEDPNDRTICESTASHQDAPTHNNDATPQMEKEECKKKEKTKNSLRNSTLVSENSTPKSVIPPDSPNTRSKMRKLQQIEAKESIRKLTLETQAKELNSNDGCLTEQGDGSQNGAQTKDPDQTTPLTLPLASKNKDLQFILSRVIKNRSSTEKKEPIPPDQELNPGSGPTAQNKNESGENKFVSQVSGRSSVDTAMKEKKKGVHTMGTDSRSCVVRETRGTRDPVSKVHGRSGLDTVMKEKDMKKEIQAMETDSSGCITREAVEMGELSGSAGSEPANDNAIGLVDKIMCMAGFSQRPTAADFMAETNTGKKYKIPKLSKAPKKTISSKEEEDNQMDLFEDILVGRDRDELMKEIEKLKIERDSLQQSRHTLQERCSGLEKDNEVLLKNMSSLWKTSMAQLRQKSNELAAAKREKEAIIFRRAMRQVPRDELDRVASHIAAYDKEEFAEFISKLREKDEDGGTKECMCGRGTPTTRRFGTAAQRVREAALGSRLSPSSDSEAQTLRTLLGRKGETVTHSEEKPESWSKKRGLTRSPKSQRRLFASESGPPESEGSRSIWDRLGRNPLDRRKSGIEDERKERHTEKGRGASEEFGSRNRTEKGRVAGEERASKTPLSESTGGKRKSVFSRLSIKRTVNNQEDSASVKSNAPVDNDLAVPDSHPDSEIPREKTGKRNEAKRTVTLGDQRGMKARSSESCVNEPPKDISTTLNKPPDVYASPSLNPDRTDTALSAQELEDEPEYCPGEDEVMLSKTLFGQRMRRRMEKLQKPSPVTKPLKDLPVLSSPVVSQDKSSEATQQHKQLPLQDEVKPVTNSPAMNTRKPVSVESMNVDTVTNIAFDEGEPAANSPRNIRKAVSVESKNVDAVTNRAFDEGEPLANTPAIYTKRSVSVESMNVDTVTNRAFDKGEPAANSPALNTRKSLSVESKSVDTVTNRDEGDMSQEILKHDVQKDKEPVEDNESGMRKSQSSVQKDSDGGKTEGLKEADVLKAKKVKEVTEKGRNSENISVAVKESGRRCEDDSVKQNPETEKEENESVGNEQVMESTEKTLTTEHEAKQEAARVEKPDCEDIDSEEINTAIMSLAKLRSAFHSEERKVKTKTKKLKKQKRLSLFGGGDSSDEDEMAGEEACKENQETETRQKASSGNMAATEKLEIEGNVKKKSVNLLNISREMEELLDMVENADCENFNIEMKQMEKGVAESKTEHTEIDTNKKSLKETKASIVAHQVQVQEAPSEKVEITERKGRSKSLKKTSTPKSKHTGIDTNKKDLKETEASIVAHQVQVQETPSEKVEITERKGRSRSLKKASASSNKKGLKVTEASIVTHQVQAQEAPSEEVEITNRKGRSRSLKKASASSSKKGLKETETGMVAHQVQAQEVPSEKVKITDRKGRSRSLKKASASNTEEEENRSTEKEPTSAEDKNTQKIPVKRAKLKKEPNKKGIEEATTKNDDQQIKETTKKDGKRNTDDEETKERRKTEDQSRKVDRQTRAKTKGDSREEDESKKVSQQRKERTKRDSREEVEERKDAEQTKESTKTGGEENEGRNIDQQRRERRKTASREEDEKKMVDEETKESTKAGREENEGRNADQQRRERRKTASREEDEKKMVDEETKEKTKTGKEENEGRNTDQQRRRKTNSKEENEKRKIDEQTKESTKADSTEEGERKQRRERRKTNSKEEHEHRKVDDQTKESTKTDSTEEGETRKTRKIRKTASRNEDKSTNIDQQTKETTKTDINEGDESTSTCQRTQAKGPPSDKRLKHNKSSAHESTTEIPEDSTRPSQNKDEGRKSTSRKDSKREKDVCKTRKSKRTTKGKSDESTDAVRSSKLPRGKKVEALSRTPTPDTSGALGSIDEVETNALDGMNFKPRAEDKRAENASSVTDTKSFEPQTEDHGAESVSPVTDMMRFKPRTEDHEAENASSATDTTSFKPQTEDLEAENTTSVTDTMNFKPQTEDLEAENATSVTDTISFKPLTEDQEAENATSVTDMMSFKPRTEDHEADNASSEADTNAVQQRQDHQANEDNNTGKENEGAIEDNPQESKEETTTQKEINATKESVGARENDQATSEEPQTVQNMKDTERESPNKSSHESDVRAVDPSENASKDSLEEDGQETDILTSLLGTNYDEDSLFYQEEELLYDEGSEEEEEKHDKNESAGRKGHEEEESQKSKTDSRKHDRKDEQDKGGHERMMREADKISSRDEEQDIRTRNSPQEDKGDKTSHTTLPFLNPPSQKLKLPGGRIKKLTTSPRDKGSRGIEEGVSPLLVRGGRRGEKPEVRASRGEGESPRSQGKRKETPEKGRRTREARSSHVLLSQNRKSPPRLREGRLGTRKRERVSESDTPGKRERSPRTRGERSSPRQREVLDEREQPASKRRRVSVKSRLTFRHNSDEENITRPARRQSSALEVERTRTSSRHRNQSGEKRPAADTHTHTRESSQQDGAQLSSLTDGKPKISTSAVPVDSKLLQSVLAQSPSKLMAQGDEKEEGELDDEEEEEGEDRTDRKTCDSEKTKVSDTKRQTEVLKDAGKNKAKRSSKERQSVSPDNRDMQGGKASKTDKQNTSISTNKEEPKLGDVETCNLPQNQASQDKQRHKSGGAVERVNSPRSSQRIRNSSNNQQPTSQTKPPTSRKKLTLSETLTDHETEEPKRDGKGASECASTTEEEDQTHRKSCTPRNENALRKRSPLSEPLPDHEIEKPKRVRKDASELASAIEEEGKKVKSCTPRNENALRKKSPLSEALQDQQETEKDIELHSSAIEEDDQKSKRHSPRKENALRKKSPLSEALQDPKHSLDIEEENEKQRKSHTPLSENELRKRSPNSDVLHDQEHSLDTEEENLQQKTHAPLNENKLRKWSPNSDALQDQEIEAPKRDGKGDLEHVEKAERDQQRKRRSCAPMDEDATFYPGDLYRAMQAKAKKAQLRKDPSASSISSLSDDTIDLLVRQHNEKFSDVTNASDDSETSLLKYIADDDDDDNDGDDESESESEEEIDVDGDVDTVEEKETNKDNKRENEGEFEFEDDGKQIEMYNSDDESETEEEVEVDDDVRAVDENKTYGINKRKEAEIEYKDDREQAEMYSSDDESETEEEIEVDDDLDAVEENKTHRTNERENEGEIQYRDNTTGQNKGNKTMKQDTKQRPTLEQGESASTAHPTLPYHRDTTPMDECESEDESSSATSPESAPGVSQRNSATPVFMEQHESDSEDEERSEEQNREHDSDSDGEGSESRSTRNTPTPASATHHSDSEEECSRERNTATPLSPVSATHHSDSEEEGSENQNSHSPISEMQHSDSEEEEGSTERNTRNTPTPASMTHHSDSEEGSESRSTRNTPTPASATHHSDSEEEEDSRKRNTRNTPTPASATHHSDSEEGSENQNSLSPISEMQHSYSEESSRERNTRTPVTEVQHSDSEEEEDCAEGSVHSTADAFLPDTSEDEDMSSSEESELDVETVDSEPEQPAKEVQQSGLSGSMPLDQHSSDGPKDTDDTELATELPTAPLDEGRVTTETQDVGNNSSSSDDSDSDSDCQCSDCNSSSSSSSGSDSSSSSSSDSEEESAVVKEAEGVRSPKLTGEDFEEESHGQASSHSYADPPTQAPDKPKSPNETSRKTPRKTPKKTPSKTPNAKLGGSQNSTTPFKKTPRKSPCKKTPCKKSPLKKAQGKAPKKNRRVPVCPPAASPVKEPQATFLASPVAENFIDNSSEAVDNTRILSPQNTQPRDTTRILSPQNTQPRDTTRILSPQNTQPRDTTRILSPQNTQPRILSPQNTQPRNTTRILSPQNTQPRILSPQNTQPRILSPPNIQPVPDAETPLGSQVTKHPEGPGKTQQKSTTTPVSGRGSSLSKGHQRQVTPLPNMPNSQSFQLKQKISPIDSSPISKTFYLKRRVSSLRVANAAPSMPLIDTGIVPVKGRSTIAASPSRTVKLSCSNDSPVISVVHSRQGEESEAPQRAAVRTPKKVAQEVKVPTPTSNKPVAAKKRQRPPSPVLCDARNSSGKRLRTLSPSMYDSVSPRKLFSDATNVKQKAVTITHSNPESSSSPSDSSTKASISKEVVVPVTIRRAKRQLNLQLSTSPAKHFSFISASDQEDSTSPSRPREGGSTGQALRKSPRKSKRVTKLNL
ncbi:serine-rich adhesin for platelets-like isoform X2 [Eriocheir sinensis]|uniref:serine-rich adhesin for platelets-like isoform X2 n=1 Tax=Eriocheir sinensis TaxID=95602 RepID=UPI0021C888BD|nr:serine-rich adhesin for platelets-like isoform X2 [Eriocheir sinensis]